MKRATKIRILIASIMLAMVAIAQAQSSLDQAFELYDNKKYDEAKVAIDKAVLESGNENEPGAWQLRGYIYKDLYNKYQKTDKYSPYRIEAISALKKSIILDKEKELLEQNVQAMKYLLGSMNNDVDESLDPVEYETAIDVFRKYQDYYRIIDPTQEGYKAREINFAMSLGSVYNTIIESSQDDTAKINKYMYLAKGIFQKVLSMDPNNISANYNMAILYYNQAVNLVKYQDYDMDLSLMDDVEDKSKRLFNQSLPFMQNAYKLDPKREDVLNGLSGIYFGLNDKATSDIYRRRLQEVKQDQDKK